MMSKRAILAGGVSLALLSPLAAHAQGGPGQTSRLPEGAGKQLVESI